MLRTALTPVIPEERSLTNDLRYGRDNETSIVELLNTYFDDEFKNTKELYRTPYYQYDFESVKKKICIELKSRRNRYEQYPTTIVPVSKANDTIEHYVFVFQFTDGVYFINYNKEQFENYEVKMIKTFRKGIYDKPKPHFCIRIEDLIKMTTCLL